MKPIICFSIIAGLFLAACKTLPPSAIQQEPLSRTDSTVTVVAGKIYQANETKRFLLGDHYRDVWLEPVEVPIIDLKTEKGGLEILEKGGGMQTQSLKLKAADGKLYSLRSIQKDPSSVLPKLLRKTIADDVVQDQISAAHPYGAFILPLLGDAAGIYHTNPELFYLPDTHELGEFQEDFGGMLVMLEEDADEDWSDYEDFGYTENAVSTNTVREDLLDDNDNQVDQRMLLRARLFDILIGDWDRHDGQWRWAEIEKEDEKGILFRPIPEDRDNVFFKFDGAIPWIASRKWAARKFQNFDYEIRDMKGLNYNARDFDRRFLTEPDREDWLAVADTLQRRLTNDIIEEAVSIWPEGVYELTGKEIADKLKVRRDKLKEFALRYYEILSEDVEVHGSDKNEFFEVERLSDDSTRVRMYKSNEDGEKEKLLYERTFNNGETDEVILYGFEGADFFHVSGDVKNSVKLRIIGGLGPDKITDESHVSGLARKTKIYDLIEDTELELSTESHDLTSDSWDAIRYDFESYNYDIVAPQVFFGYNVDDGVFIGGGLLWKTYGFRDDEFSTRQRLVGNVALKTGAYNFIYEGEFRSLFREVDLDIDLEVRAPDFTSNYFGQGNDTEKVNEENDYYRYKRDDIDFDPGLQLRFGKNNFFKFGPSIRFDDVRSEEFRFISSSEAGIPAEAFDKKLYGGIAIESAIINTDNIYYPQRGVSWITTAGMYFGMFGEENNYSRIESNFTAYVTPLNGPVTLAARIGGASNIGDFYFFQSNTLGGNQGFNAQGRLRGFVRDRFAGRSSAYNNLELRLQLFEIDFFFLPLQLGAMGFLDHGRVFSDVSESNEWHRGYGGGLFLRPVDKWVFTATYAISEEDNLINVNLGFLF